MIETPREAAKRLAASAIQKGFKPQALHAYTDPSGCPIYWRVRLKHPLTGEKWIRPMRLNGAGYELGEPEFLPANGCSGKPIYNLHNLAERWTDPVFVVEGEFCADALSKLGVLTTTSGSSDSAAKADWACLAGRKVMVWPDNDDAGLRYARDVAGALIPLGCEVQVVDVDALGLPVKGDAVDWLEANPGATSKSVFSLKTNPPIKPESAAARAIIPGVPHAIIQCVDNITAVPIKWLWPGRIAKGKITTIAGHPGLGKSQLALHLAAVTTTGGRWPVTGERAEISNVLILSAEDDAADTIRPRLEAAGADLKRCFIFDGIQFLTPEGRRTTAFDLSGDVDILVKECARIGDVALVIIDPVSAYLGGTDSHKNAEVRAVLAGFSDAAAKHGFAALAISHFSKAGGGEALLRVMGSLAFVAAARAAYAVVRDPDNTDRRLFLPLKNNLGNDQDGCAFRVMEVRQPGGIVTTRLDWESEAVVQTADEIMGSYGDPEERSALDEAKDFLHSELEHGPLSAKRVRSESDGAGHSWRTIRRAAKALGVITKKEGMRGPWTWELPTKVAKDPEGVHANNVDTLGVFGHLGGDDADLEDGEI